LKMVFKKSGVQGLNMVFLLTDSDIVDVSWRYTASRALVKLTVHLTVSSVILRLIPGPTSSKSQWLTQSL
jgi:hypothetical protein